jgi:hypothetical protein
MSDVGYIAAGYVVAAVALGGYAVRLLVRGRALSKRVPPEGRRWM